MILNRQNRVTVATGPLEVFLSRIRRKLGLSADSFSVCFVSESAIARWNRTYRSKSGPTDVLSFPADRAHGAEEPRQGSRVLGKQGEAKSVLRAQKRNGFSTGDYLGDIAISPETARRNARGSGRTLDGELRALILHGVLHLLGYDHETDHGEMNRRERRLRRELGLS
jgi:probable rRNA maturation factor